MQISNVAAGVIAAACVTAGAAIVQIGNAAGPSAPTTPIETVVAAAPHTFAPVQTATISPAVASTPRVNATARIAPDSGVPAETVRAGTVPAGRASARTVSTRTVPARTVPQRRADRSGDRVAATPEQAPQIDAPRNVSTSVVDSPVADSSSNQRVQTTSSFAALTVPLDSVLGLQIESALTSETAKVEDEIIARVTRDVRVGDRVAIPSGAEVHGEVTLVERGGRLKDRSRLGIRFTSVALADGTRIPIATDTIIREGSSPGRESAAKIGGGAVGGAIVGGLMGGARGAMIGSSVGAGAGTAAVMVGGRNAATFPAGAPISARLVEPATVTVDY